MIAVSRIPISFGEGEMFWVETSSVEGFAVNRHVLEKYVSTPRLGWLFNSYRRREV